MQISELIEKLEEIKLENGDKEVYFISADDSYYCGNTVVNMDVCDRDLNIEFI